MLGATTAAALLLASVQALARRREAAALRDYPPEGRITTVNGHRVHSITMGEGPDLVLIHGASGNTRDMTFGFAQSLADRYRVTIFDRPGLGHTDRLAEFDRLFEPQGEGPVEQARLLQAAAAALGIERPLVLGHSLGGAVALAWALEAPDKIAALVDVAGVAMPWPGELDPYYRLTGTALGGAVMPPFITALVPQSHIDATIESIFAPDPAPEGYAAAVGAPLTIRRRSIRANTRQVNTLRPRIVEMSARYNALTLPIEIVHGDADTIVPLNVHSIPLSQIAPHAHLTVLPGVGHMPHHTARADVAAAIDRAATRAGLR